MQMNLAMCGNCLCVFNKALYIEGCPICSTSKYVIDGLTIQEVFKPFPGASPALNETIIQSSYNLILQGQVM